MKKGLSADDGQRLKDLYSAQSKRIPGFLFKARSIEWDRLLGLMITTELTLPARLGLGTFDIDKGFSRWTTSAVLTARERGVYGLKETEVRNGKDLVTEGLWGFSVKLVDLDGGNIQAFAENYFKNCVLMLNATRIPGAGNTKIPLPAEGAYSVLIKTGKSRHRPVWSVNRTRKPLLPCMAIPVFCQSIPAPERRVALVIGNSAHAANPFGNHVNGATDMAAALRELGFTVTLPERDEGGDGYGHP